MPQVTVLSVDVFDKLIAGKVTFSSLGALTIQRQEMDSLIAHIEKQSFDHCLPDIRVNLSRILLDTYKVLLNTQVPLAKRYAEQGLRILANSTEPSVVLALSKHHQQGIPDVLPADLKKYVVLLQQAVEKEYKPAQLYWAEHQCNGLFEEKKVLVKKDPAAAVILLETISEYPNAAFALFLLYWPQAVAIAGVEKSAAKAVTFLVQAANAGHTEAMFIAFELYEKGLSEQNADRVNCKIIEQNLPQALRWLEKVAKAGHIEASYQWGQRLETGVTGVLPIDKKTALLYFRQAATQKHVKAQEAVLRLDPCGFKDDIERLKETVTQLHRQVLALQKMMTPTEAASFSAASMLSSESATTSGGLEETVTAQEVRIAILESSLAALQISLDAREPATRSWLPNFMAS